MSPELRLLPGGAGGAPVPPERPRPMPTQPFERRPARVIRKHPDWVGWAARAAVFGCSAWLVYVLVAEMRGVLDVGGLTAFEWAMLVLFALNMAWIGTSCVSSLFGFAWLVLRRPTPAVPGYRPHGRTALLLPAYNEDTRQILAYARAMLEDLAKTGAGDRFDLFVLSDTTDPAVWLREERETSALRAELDLPSKIYYRHRLRNDARKAGNVADFCRRWGGAYEYLVVLDADSLMEGGTVLELARRIEAEPDLGLLQTVPRLVGRSSVLGRMQQFATRMYGPVVAAGLAFWHRDSSNYWGHNAIMRTEAFAGHAGLPELPGRPPFGGHVLSHDFVEAALIRRAGYGVRMAVDLPGSYEDSPPTLIDLATRDRRWAQGNLQHARVLTARGLHPLSRLHMVWGILSYLASPLWLLFLLTGLGLAVQVYWVQYDYFPDEATLFPIWPVIDAERALALFVVTMGVLLLPKLLGLVVYALDPRGGALKPAKVALAGAGVALETLLSALVAPILMLTQTKAVVEILLRKDSGWRPQSRDDGQVPWRTLLRFHRNHVVVGMLLGAAAGAISWQILAWMSPAVIGLVLAVPLSAFVASRPAGRWLRRFGLLNTPEEDDPPAVVRRATGLRAMQRPEPSLPPLETLLASSDAFQRHLDWLDPGTARRTGEVDTDLATALLKIDEVPHPAKLLRAFTPAEELAVLKSGKALKLLRARFA